MTRTRLLALALGAAALAAPATPAEAQYFGRNKVQYESFDFQVLKTEHFDIYYYPQERDAVLLAARMAERWYSRLSRLLNYEFTSRQPLIMYANHPHFEQTNALSGELGEATGGVTEVFKRRMVLPFAAGLKETDHVIGHELVHAFQFAITGEGRSVQTGGIPGALRLPLWFVEGMAEYLSVGPEDPLTAMWMRDAMEHQLPTLRQMGSDPYRWFPYRYGQAFWSFVAGRYGDEVVGRLLKSAGRAPDPEVAMARILGGTSKELSDQWHQAIREAYAPLTDLTRRAGDYGQPLFVGDANTINVSPVLSPDGRYVAFISTRDLFSVDVFIAERATGKVIRKLTRTAVDPHLESLQFINSAGTWSPDGKTFALAAVSKGHPLISLIDVESGDRVRDLRFPELGEIYSPSWSPDGRYLAFAAIVGGMSDLFLYDLREGRMSRLTNDPYADLQPSWSPDGTRLAFTTDRFGSDLELLRYGRYEIALLDPASGTVRQVTTFDAGQQTSPQWAPDGDGLYFLSSRTGITNLYRVSVGSGELRQVTNLFTGISGITPLSPAITVALESGDLIFTSYEADSYELYQVTDAAVLAGAPVEPRFVSVNPALLPPAQRITDQLTTTLADLTTGLPDTAEFVTRPYSAALSLDFVSQPSLIFASDQYGTYLGGGAALYWSDMLGNRSLLTALQVNGGVKDIAAIVGYTNLRRRFNWGLVAQNVPITYGFLSQGIATIDGQSVLIEQIERFRQTNREVAALGAYPFSRSQRVEFSTGFRVVSFEREIQTRGFRFSDGEQVLDSTVTESIFDPVYMATGSVALVYDKSLLGATSPIIGQRYRLEAAPVAGSINYVNLLGDFRRYFVPVRPFTLAFRLLHFGRYAGDAEDQRLRPLYIGFPGLVRGYDDNSFSGAECNPIAADPATGSGGDPCPEFSRLLGSRLLMANAELRFPLLGALGIGSGYYGFLPLELAFFADGGLPWSSDDSYTLTGLPTAGDERAFFLGGDRKPVYSAGVGLRANLLGFAVLELDFVRAFQRGKWVWQFAFTPGF